MISFFGSPTWTPGELQDLVFFQRGFDITKAQQEEGTVPVFSSSGLGSYHNVAKVRGPGVIIGRKGTLGTVFFSKGDYWPHDTTLWSKDLKGNNARFVYYALQCIDLALFDTGAANPTLNRNHIHRLPIFLPDRSIQDRIADILSPYDDLIDANERRITLLEEAARHLFNEWFVRLRFPGHEHVKIADAVPEGWQRQHLSEIFDTQYGFTETASDECVGPKFLRGTDINKTSYIDWSCVPYCPDDKLNFEKYSLKIGDILVIRMADPGKVGIVEQDVEAVFASYLIRLQRKPGVDIPPLYLFYVLSGSQYQGFISGASGGSTRKSANANLVVDFEICVPTETLLTGFVEEVEPLRKEIQTLLKANAAARAARDLLLPRLMNGSLAA